MKTYLISICLMLAFDTVAKMWRVYTRTPPTIGDLLVDAVSCVVFLVWGVWALASA